MQHIFPPDFVFWTSIENHKEVKDYLLPLIKQKEEESIKTPTRWYCDVNSSFEKNSIGENNFNQFLLDPKIIKDIVWNPLDKMLSEVKNLPIPKESSISECWYNSYTIGQYQEIHNHLADSFIVNEKSFKDTFSLIYIIDSQDEKNRTMFYSLGPHSCTNELNNLTFDTSNEESICEGTVLIFPCHLLHYVQPTKNSRTTISYNIASSF